jgi:pilus assembly protein CpaB
VTTAHFSRIGARRSGVRGVDSPGRLRSLYVFAMLGGWPRRLAALVLLLLACLSWLQDHRAPPPDARAGTAVLTAARDVASGAVLGAADLRMARYPPSSVPVGALHSARSALGRTLAGAVRRGEPITDVRLVGPGLVSGLAGADAVAVPVRLADGDAARLVRVGDRIDILATYADGAADPAEPSPTDRTVDATPVAAGVRVLAVLARADAASEDGFVIVVASTAQAARRLAGAAAHARLSVAMRPP